MLRSRANGRIKSYELADGVQSRVEAGYDKVGTGPNLACARTHAHGVGANFASMISFGFTIYKFFEFEAAGKVVDRGLPPPRMFALVMVSIGLFAVLLATAGHRRVTRALAVQMPEAPKSFAEAVAGIVSVFGILVLFATALRH